MDRTLLGGTGLQVRGGVVRVASGNASGPSLAIGAKPAIVGRHSRCDLVLRDPKVSATHLELQAVDLGVRLRDLGSTNGTYLGADRVARVVEALLTKPVEICCGDAVLEFEPHEPERVPLSRSRKFGRLVGATPAMRALFERLEPVARSTLSVLIEGETGTGKEVVAEAIHRASERADKPFVVIDCATLPASLAESVLFGHEKGAFTGATERRVSPFVEATGGTVFLDELGELPLDLQPKLLRVLAEQRVKAVGSTRYVSVDVRVIAATRRDLLAEINRGAFRDDLYFRIKEERVRLPPLRERRGDLRLLVEQLMADFGQAGAFARVTPESIDRLMDYSWPGNVRELRSLVKRALAYDRGEPLDLTRYLDPHDHGAPKVNGSGAVGTYEQAKRAYFEALYEAAGGNLAEMARRGEMSRVTVRASLRRYGIGKGGPAKR